MGIELMRETINESLIYMPKLVEGIRREINYINKGEYSEAIILLKSIIEGIDWSIQAIILTAPLHGYDLDMERINKSLKNLALAMENGDFQLLSDILEYEIIDVLMGYIDYCLRGEFSNEF